MQSRLVLIKCYLTVLNYIIQAYVRSSTCGTLYHSQERRREEVSRYKRRKRSAVRTPGAHGRAVFSIDF